MKVYQCDSCKTTIENPHKELMKEFYVGVTVDACHAYPCNTKRKVKIHLCDNCFCGLRMIAEKALKERGKNENNSKA